MVPYKPLSEYRFMVPYKPLSESDSLWYPINLCLSSNDEVMKSLPSPKFIKEVKNQTGIGFMQTLKLPFFYFIIFEIYFFTHKKNTSHRLNIFGTMYN